MDEKIVILVILPLVALFLILSWCLLLSRGGRPLQFVMKGFGISIKFESKGQIDEASKSS